MGRVAEHLHLGQRGVQGGLGAQFDGVGLVLDDPGKGFEGLRVVAPEAVHHAEHLPEEGTGVGGPAQQAHLELHGVGEGRARSGPDERLLDDRAVQREAGRGQLQADEGAAGHDLVVRAEEAAADRLDGERDPVHRRSPVVQDRAQQVCLGGRHGRDAGHCAGRGGLVGDQAGQPHGRGARLRGGCPPLGECLGETAAGGGAGQPQAP